MSVDYNCVRPFRESAGLTLTELATRAGVSEAFLSSVERGETSPRLPTMIAIAAPLGVSVPDAFPGTPAGPGVPRAC